MTTELTRTPSNGHFASVNGFEMYYETHGAGEPLVLLHGYTGSSQQFQPYIGGFAEHYRVIVPDLRGHGRSPDTQDRFTLKQAAGDIFALIDHLGIDRFRGIGCSAGGCVFQYMAGEEPRLFDALILESCGSYFSKQTSDALHGWVDTPDEELEQKKYRHVHGVPQLRSLFNKLPKLVDHYNAHPPRISNIESNTLIVMGDRDELYPVSIALEMYAAIPNSYLWIVPNGQHFGILNNPDIYLQLFTRNALEFMAGAWQ